MQFLNVTALPIYLPYDTAPVPFGDPLTDVTITSSTTAVVQANGYNAPAVNDAVAFSTTSAAGLAAPIVAGTTYYVKAIVSTANGTFSISATKGGAVIATTTSTTANAQVSIHLLSKQVDGTTVPFKTGATAVVMNLSASNSTLLGAPDLNTTTYGNPQGPNTAAQVTLATITSGTLALAVLSTDWIYASSAGNLVLLQN